MQAYPQTNRTPRAERRLSVERRCWNSRNRSSGSANSSFNHLFGESKGAGCSLEGRLLNVPRAVVRAVLTGQRAPMVPSSSGQGSPRRDSTRKPRKSTCQYSQKTKGLYLASKWKQNCQEISGVFFNGNT